MKKVLPWIDAAVVFTAIAALFLAVFHPASTFLPGVKAAPALLLALSWLAFRSPGWGWMAAGLAFAAVGDYLLALHGPWFLWGGGAFAVMQLLFSIRLWGPFTKQTLPWKKVAGATLPWIVVSIVILAFAWIPLGGLALPMAAYAVLLIAMTSGTLVGKPWYLAVGGVLFFVSDAQLLIYRAWPVSFSTELPILVPYYLAQILITLGLRTGSTSRSMPPEQRPPQ